MLTTAETTIRAERIPIQLAPKTMLITSLLQGLADRGRTFARLNQASGVAPGSNGAFAFVKGRPLGLIDSLAAGQKGWSRAVCACRRIAVSMNTLMDIEDGWNGVPNRSAWATVGRLLAAKFVDGAV